jgi:hypothetical protein
MMGVSVVHQGGQRGEDPNAGWDPRAAGRGGSGLPGMVSGRRGTGGLQLARPDRRADSRPAESGATSPIECRQAVLP